MSKYEYVKTTTGRFTKWVASYLDEHGGEPPLEKILYWLRNEEHYARPLEQLRELCSGLIRANESAILQWITGELIDSLQKEREFGDTAERFFNAMVRRCGVDDTDVNIYSNHKLVGTLHDVQSAAANSSGEKDGK